MFGFEDSPFIMIEIQQMVKWLISSFIKGKNSLFENMDQPMSLLFLLAATSWGGGVGIFESVNTKKYIKAVRQSICFHDDVLYFILMEKQTRMEFVNKVINQKKGKLNLHELQVRFCSRLTSKIIRKYEFTNNKFLKKYRSIERKYQKGVCRQLRNGWHDNQRKIFIWFSIIFCNHLKLNYDQLTSKHWEQLSFLFYNKNILLLKYQTKQIQRNPQRVNWDQKEQNILIDAFSNGKRSQWNQISKRIFFQTEGKYYKNSKQCREHWFNHLDQSKKKGDWTKLQDLLLLQAVQRQGRKWSIVSKILEQRRTQHSIKNRYHSLMKINHKRDDCQVPEQQKLANLIAQLQTENQQNRPQIDEIESQNSQIREQQSESENPLSQSDQIIQHPRIAQLNINEEQVLQNNQLVSSHSWNNLPPVHSPYFFVFSPFSFSSTASPYMNSQSWSSWQNNAHQTLFFNPGNIQQMPSFSTFQAMSRNDQNQL